MEPWQVLVLLICGCIGIPIGSYKNDWWRGFLAGLILGPIGLIIMAVIPQSERARVRREKAKLLAREEAQRQLDAERAVQS